LTQQISEKAGGGNHSIGTRCAPLSLVRRRDRVAFDEAVQGHPQAGRNLKHSMVDAKWPAFEDAFKGFEPKRVRALNDEQVEALMRDKRLIRHWGKIKSVRDNAAAICALEEETGGIGSYLGDWPGERIVELWDDLTRRFTQLGGNSGPYFLRMAGKDTFLLTGDVVHALNRWGAIEGEPKGKRARRDTQALFNRWAEEAERPLCQISMILAVSVR
jgi:3-methyladenine DNA glycosylase Tag